jgi:hypothetical protein
MCFPIWENIRPEIKLLLQSLLPFPAWGIHVLPPRPISPEFSLVILNSFCSKLYYHLHYILVLCLNFSFTRHRTKVDTCANFLIILQEICVGLKASPQSCWIRFLARERVGILVSCTTKLKNELQ